MNFKRYQTQILGLQSIMVKNCIKSRPSLVHDFCVQTYIALFVEVGREMETYEADVDPPNRKC